MRNGRIPEATVARLPVYLQVLVDAAADGIDTLASDDLARASGVNAAKVRKDLSYLGTHGTRGVGYDVDRLAASLSEALGVVADRPLLLVGAGNLGRALASYGGFADRGFRLVGLLDADPGVIGAELAGLRVAPVADLEELVTAHQVALAVLAIPAEAAQPVTDRLVAAGVRAILSFAPTHLRVPPEVTVRRVDLATELQILAFYEQLDRAPGSGGREPDAVHK
ncbi:MAG: redox-sensing transcriptional repressor Rex [Nitriliruptoraceae bacterium]